MLWISDYKTSENWGISNQIHRYVIEKGKFILTTIII